MTTVAESKVLGRRLRGVQYDLFEWDDAPDATVSVDTVPKAVILVLDELSVVLTWELRPPAEQLTMAVLGGMYPDPALLFRRLDVSRRWSAFLGAELVSTSWAEQETGDGVQPWAVTLVFAGVGTLVVALGEVLDGSPSYIPDSLVVTASRDVACAYRPPAALSAALTTKP